MTRMSHRVTIVALTSLALLAFAAAPARAQCSAETLHGSYGFTISGTNFARDVPWAMVGRFVSDGKGNLTATATQSTKGDITQAKFTGTYQVTDECLGNATFTFGSNAFHIVVQFVIVDSGRRLEMIVADQGVLEFGSATKIATTPQPDGSSGQP